MTHRFETEYWVRDRVQIDGDTSLTAVVTGVGVFVAGVCYRLEWFAAGVPQQTWVEEWRVNKVQ